MDIMLILDVSHNELHSYLHRSYQTIQLQLVLYFIWSHEDTFQGKEVCLFKLISDSKVINLSFPL